MVKKSFQSICKRALLLISRIHMWRNRNNRDIGIYMYWHFPQHPFSLTNDFYAASDNQQFILASSIFCQSTKHSWNMFGITNQDTATTFYLYHPTPLQFQTYTYTCIRNVAAFPEWTKLHVYMWIHFLRK